MPRAPKSSPTKVKGKPEPYSRSSPQHTPPLDGASGSTSIPSTPKKTYDKSLMVRYVLESCANINWEAVAELTGKDATKSKDTWRKTIQPLLISNQPWSTSGPGWNSIMKIQMVTKILESAKPDWQAATTVHFPGKTKSQLGDVWRKVVLPRLKKGETIE